MRYRTAFSVALVFVLAACAGGPKVAETAKVDKKYGVAPSPRVAQGSKVPKGGGRYVVGKPYKVAGKTYHPREDRNYKRTGLASWYGKAFHGRLTANGEVYDMNRLTAAHTTMPLPSYARVTNLNNGRSVIFRVNDRGPFHGNREIDVSHRGAEMLDFKEDGITKVRVEYVGRARLDGQDDEYLMASYRGPGSVVPGGTRPGTQLASLDPVPRGAVVREPAPVAPTTKVASAKQPASGTFGRPIRTGFWPSGSGSALDHEMLAFNGYGRETFGNGFAIENSVTRAGTRTIRQPVLRQAPRGLVPPASVPGNGVASYVPSYAPESRINKAFIAISELYR